MNKHEKSPSKHLSSERCKNCPSRGRISRALARLASKDTPSDCRGPVTVHHGKAISEDLPHRVRDEKTGRIAPGPKPSFDYNIASGPSIQTNMSKYMEMMSNDEITAEEMWKRLDEDELKKTVRYTGVEWTEETVCGKNDISPQEDEILYNSNRPEYTDDDGNRHIRFISGSKEALQEIDASQAMTRLISASYQVEDEDPEVSKRGSQYIASQGFKLEATVTSDSDADWGESNPAWQNDTGYLEPDEDDWGDSERIK